MSKLSEYSKFDHLDDDDSSVEDVVHHHQAVPVRPQQQQQSPQLPSSTTATTTTPAETASAASPSPVATTTTSTPNPCHHSPIVQGNQNTNHNHNNSSNGTDTSIGARMRKDMIHPNRFIFEFNGKSIYSWEQTLDDVTIYVPAPSFVQRANQIICHITPNHLQLGLQHHQQWFLNEPTFGTVDISESTWSLEDNDDDDKNDKNTNNKIITIYLTKAQRALVWEAALTGAPAAAASTTNNNTTNQTSSSTSSTSIVRLDPDCIENEKKKLLLERFQEEHRGMDFRDADFNGSVPDARTFMGGVNYQ